MVVCVCECVCGGRGLGQAQKGEAVQQHFGCLRKENSWEHPLPTTHNLLLHYGRRSQSKEPQGILGVIMSNHQ